MKKIGKYNMNLGSRFTAYSCACSIGNGVISNDVMVNDLLLDLFNCDGVTNFFYTGTGINFSISCGKDEEFNIVVDWKKNKFNATSNIDGVEQEISVISNDNGTEINISKSLKIKEMNDYILRNFKVKKIYDCFGQLLFNEKVTHTIDSEDSSLSTISIQVIDGVACKIIGTFHTKNPENDRVTYYVLIDPNNEKRWIKISENEFHNRFGSKSVEKVLKKDYKLKKV